MVYNDTVMDTIFQPNISRVKEATLVMFQCYSSSNFYLGIMK